MLAPLDRRRGHPSLDYLALLAHLPNLPWHDKRSRPCCELPLAKEGWKANNNDKTTNVRVRSPHVHPLINAPRTEYMASTYARSTFVQTYVHVKYSTYDRTPPYMLYGVVRRHAANGKFNRRPEPGLYRDVHAPCLLRSNCHDWWAGLDWYWPGVVHTRCVSALCSLLSSPMPHHQPPAHPIRAR